MIKLNKQLFWDIDFKKLDYKKHAQFVIGRILDFGDDHEVKWMFRYFKEKQIKKTLLERRGISHRSASYWAEILNIPKNQIQSLKRHSKIWPY